MPASHPLEFDSRRCSIGTSALTALIPIVVNAIMSQYVTRSVTSYEGNDTQTAHETSIFAKLSLAYVFNTAIIPLAVGVYFSLQVRQPTRHQTGGRGPAAAPLTALLVRRCPTVRSISLGTRRAVWCRRPSS